MPLKSDESQESSLSILPLSPDAYSDKSDPSSINISNQIMLIDIAMIEPDSDQPRKIFDSETLINLQNSIEQTTLQNPILVRRNEEIPNYFIFVDGERRWRAYKELKHSNIPCRVVTTNAEGYQIMALTQNLQREDLLPIEKAAALASLLEKLKGSDQNAKQRTLSERFRQRHKQSEGINAGIYCDCGECQRPGSGRHEDL
jgi:ParB/RepB/Spo0J family partition protein